MTWEPVMIPSRRFNVDTLDDVAPHEPQLAAMLATYKGKSGQVNRRSGAR